MAQKMFPLTGGPTVPGEAGHETFLNFVRAVLSVSKLEIETPEQTLMKLESEKRHVNKRLKEVRAELKERKSGTVE